MKDAAELKNHVYDIVGALHSVHDELGPGINEYCYQEALAMELSDRGIPFEREKAFHPRYKGRPMDAEYRIDFRSSPPSSGISTIRTNARSSPQMGIRSKVGKRARAS